LGKEGSGVSSEMAPRKGGSKNVSSPRRYQECLVQKVKGRRYQECLLTKLKLKGRRYQEYLLTKLEKGRIDVSS